MRNAGSFEKNFHMLRSPGGECLPARFPKAQGTPYMRMTCQRRRRRQHSHCEEWERGLEAGPVPWLSRGPASQIRDDWPRRVRARPSHRTCLHTWPSPGFEAGRPGEHQPAPEQPGSHQPQEGAASTVTHSRLRARARAEPAHAPAGRPVLDGVAQLLLHELGHAGDRGAHGGVVAGLEDGAVPRSIATSRARGLPRLTTIERPPLPRGASPRGGRAMKPAMREPPTSSSPL